MSRARVRRFGRRCRSCGVRGSSVTTRAYPHDTAPWRPTGRTVKQTTLLCVGCIPAGWSQL